MTVTTLHAFTGPGSPPAENGHAATGSFLAGRHVDRRGLRDYRLYVPPGDAAAPRPLVVMLHGCTQTPEDFAAGTRMNEAARRLGLLVLYPAQCPRADAARCWRWWQPAERRRDAGEAGLLADLVRAVIAEHGADPSRVYVAGLSAGGAMAAVLAAAYPDLFAAVGVHSGPVPSHAVDLVSALAAMRGQARPEAIAIASASASASASEPATTSSGRAPRTPPVIVFHGDRDDTVHPANGAHLAGTAAHDGGGDGDCGCGCGCGGRGDCPGAAPPARERVHGARAATRRVRRDAAGRVAAEHWCVHGAGHAWSGGSELGSFTDPAGPSATEAMLKFFLSRSLRDDDAPVARRRRAGDVLAEVVVVLRRGLALARRRRKVS